tara:strand:+ start:113 stop:658 length:546 start_codon:yes stop_codon:yes gene_type:complete
MTTLLNFQLKSIKHSEFASHETHCYQATLYLNGKKFCHVNNDGFGGCDYQGVIAPFTQDDVERCNEWIANNHTWTLFTEGAVKLGDKPYIEVPPYTKDALKPNIETVCNELLTEWLIQRDIKKSLRKVCTYDRVNNSVNLWGKVKDDKAQVAAYLKKAHPEEVILNGLPMAEVTAYFRKAG